MGHKGVVRPGWCASAGTGVVPRRTRAPNPCLLRCRYSDRKGHAPQYGQLDLTENDRRKLLLVISGSLNHGAHPHPPDAAFYIAKLGKKTLTHAFAVGRLGFLFVPDGTIMANGESLKTGDAVRMAGIGTLELSGHGDVVLWDLPDSDA